MDFITREDACQGANKGTEQTPSLWHYMDQQIDLGSDSSRQSFSVDQKIWTYLRLLFKRDFATVTNDNFFIDGLANITKKLKKRLATIFRDYLSFRSDH
jgi:hypothetical protein